MVNIIIIHGSYGNPEENWFPWLKSELEKLGHTVFVPTFPTPENQSLNSWMKAFEKYKKYLNKDSLVIGHSIGATFLLSIIEQSNVSINSAFLVSGFIGSLNNPEFDKINKSFAEKKFDWKIIKNKCPNIFIFHSDNDPYVPLAKAKELSEHLDAKLTIVKNAGHFNKSAGYTEFELLLNEIKKIIN
jgi:uncharacterized protein